ncbi:MAG: SRPBCC domain-containing protein [Rhodothermaceae bacterium]|nr:MAG: SRPBCC domain-containing protein [Rhodothermaceae bacterium]
MKLYRLQALQRLPLSLDDAWAFFSRPENLRAITPPWLDFRITNTPPEVMYAGAIITYTVRPLLGVPVRWVTEITHLHAPHFFVDEQRFGPYRFWHHQHHFRPVEGGVEVEDLVHYGLPLGPLGTLAHALLVRRQLAAIFAYRRGALESRFGRPAACSA